MPVTDVQFGQFTSHPPPLRTHHLWAIAAYSLVGALLALAIVFLSVVVPHVWRDHQQLHAIIGVLNYNLESHALTLPASPPAPAPVP